MSVTIAIVGLLLLVLVHEAGHFSVAKLVGARATRFYVGFPPALVKRRHGDTEYGIGAIPLGGYVRIVGMTRPQSSDLWRIVDAADEARLRRGDQEPDRLGVAVERVARLIASGRLDDARPALADVKTALDADQALLDPRTYHQATRDLDRLTDELDPCAYWRLPVWRRIAIIAAGPAANVVAAIVILAAFFMIGEPVYDRGTHVVAVETGRPAAAAGLRAGDQVLIVNAHPITSGPQITADIQRVRGGFVRLVVLRDHRRVALSAVRPYYDQTAGRWLVGFASDEVKVGTHHDDPITATRRAFDESWRVTVGTFAALRGIATTQGRANLTTSVGLVRASSTAVSGGYYPRVLAFISLALAIFNVLPFLPLDGGHILFALIEKVRGRPLARSAFERVSVVGIALMLVLFWVGLNNDINRLSGP